MLQKILHTMFFMPIYFHAFPVFYLYLSHPKLNILECLSNQNVLLQYFLFFIPPPYTTCFFAKLADGIHGVSNWEFSQWKGKEKG